MGRTDKSIKNIFSSVMGQLLNNVLRFACRTAFIYTLGKEYLGISSLYTNILTILSVSELGFSTVITYSLYRPLAEQDIPAIQALMSYFKKAYRIIGLVILAAGLCIIPVLPKLMIGTTDKVNIYEYYILYLLQTVVSYEFFAYKGSLLIADQKKYLYDIAIYFVQIAMNAIQIVILFTTYSFFLYTVVAVICDAMQNVVTALIVDRKYPYLKEKAPKLDREKKKDVLRQVYATSLYKICTAVGTSTDNLVISSNISVLMVGIYDNYAMIIQVIHRLLQGVFQAFTSSLGNLYVTDSKEKNEFVFRCLNLLNNWVIIVCSVCFLTMFQPFITLWIGDSYKLPYLTVIVIVANFFSMYLQNIVQTYKTATGLYIYGKYRPVISAVLNLVISIILVRYLQLIGVLLGSIISRTVTTWWYDAWILYRKAFGKSPRRYYLDCGVTVVVLVGISGLMLLACRPFEMSSWINVVIRCVLSLAGSNLILFLIYGRMEEFAYLKEKGVGFLAGKLRRRK